MKKIFIFLAWLWLFLNSSTKVFAIYDPLSVPNNKVGIHIFSEKDLENAQKLINSGGGDWGYVTIVITEGERNHDRWQQVMDEMRRAHVIPIIRIATKANGNTWEKPTAEEINNWVAFLNSLNWVVKNRYVVIGNEPNLDNEWGGKSNPAEYALYLKNFAEKLKVSSDDFFVLPAGLAPNASEPRFIKSMLTAQPDVFDHIDGWTSHSYPKETLSDSSTQHYKDELTLISKDLPVFITETGWSVNKFKDVEIGQKFTFSYQNEWTDSKIVAVTPFILNYTQEPFAQFSWKKNDKEFYSFYGTVQSFSKIKGEPTQIVKGEILGALAQPVIPLGSNYIGAILTKNTGQSIWNSNEVFIDSDFTKLPIISYSFQDIEPMKLGLVVFKAASPGKTGIYTRSLFLKDRNGERITNSFPVEAVVVKFDQAQIQKFFEPVLKYIPKF
jgi:hypothetical protein